MLWFEKSATLSRSTAYRPDIDGLRAVSILLVIGYHAFPEYVTGGFIGVDIFFVISGFLITGIIAGEVDRGTFSVRSFYARRIRRIFPALITVLVITYLIGWPVLLPEAFALLGQNIAAGVAFVSNIFQLSQFGYFAPDAIDNPLLHLWSLGIEEQFYIVWPLVLLVFGRRPGRLGLIVAVALVSFGISLAIGFGRSEWFFYSPIPRAWELLAGGLLAAWRRDGAPRSADRLASPLLENVVALTSLCGIVLAATLLGRGVAYPGAYALVPVVGAAVLIVTPKSAVNRWLLASPGAVGVGLISYPLYLWHWPLLSYLHIIRTDDTPLLELWLTIALAVLLAWATYRFIEKPLRHRPRVVAPLALGLASIGLVGVVTTISGGFELRFSPQIRAIAALPSKDNAGFRKHCFLANAPASDFDESCIDRGDGPLLLVWGDSTAAAIYPGLTHMQQTRNFRIGQFTAAGCPPILSLTETIRAFCNPINERAFAFIRQSRPDVVLLHAMWEQVFNLDEFRATLESLKKLPVKRIVILGPVPIWKRGLPNTLVNYFRARHVIADRLTFGVAGGKADERMQAFAATAGIPYVSAWRVFCNSDGCLSRVGDAPQDVVAWDTIHLSTKGSEYLAEAIWRDLAVE